MSNSGSAASRRLFLQFLAASPLIGSAARDAVADEVLKIPAALPDPISWGPSSAETLIRNPDEALSVFDFELAARQRVPLAHFAKVATGSDNELTLRANRGDLAKLRLLPRRLRYVSPPDTRVELFGTTWGSPVFICPTGNVSAMHSDGSIAVSKAAEVGKHLQVLAGTEPFSIEECMQARGGTPIWFQFYPNLFDFEVTKRVVARAERHGSPVLVLTVDEPVFPNFETLERLRRQDQRDCSVCHVSAAGRGPLKHAPQPPPNFDFLTPQQWQAWKPAFGRLDWDVIRQLRDSTKMKVVLKGILSPEDALLCAKYGFDGIIVSSHGGRAGDIGTSSISALRDIVAAVRKKIPILIDSGFRRGTDIIKALAMGADAVGIGRPYLWGLGAFGQAGVERVLEILRTETAIAMTQVGASTIRDLVPDMIRRDDAWVP